MKIYRNRITNHYRIIGNMGVSNYFPTKTEALRDYDRVINNWRKAEHSRIDAEMSGTSAREARRDRGMAS